MRASQLVLIGGAVISAAAAFGPTWLVRAGVVLAVAAGVVAVVLAFRHLHSVRKQHAAKLHKINAEHGENLTAERAHNAEVVQVLTERATAAHGTVKKQQVRIGELNAKVTQLTGDNATLRSRLKSREVTISGLRETLRTRDTEISLLRSDLGLDKAEESPADVQGLPRRVQGTESGSEEDQEDSEVIDLRSVESVLPNFEVEQRRKHA